METTYLLKLYHPDFLWIPAGEYETLEHAIKEFNGRLSTEQKVTESSKFWVADFYRVSGTKMQFCIFKDGERKAVAKNANQD